MDGDGGLGRITISTGAIAQVAAYVAFECYGVVGLEARGGRIGRLLLGDAPERGVGVVHGGDGLVVTLDVVVEHGLDLAEVAATLRSRVAYEVGRLTGLRVAAVEVRVSDVRAAV
jgi:uncharacterized alkaline shock family protein YloU